MPGGKWRKRICLLMTLLLLSLCGCHQRKIQTAVLIYMIGSDLETQRSCATADLIEMCQAELGDKVCVLIQTGGAKRWHTEEIDPNTVQRFTLQNHQLVELEALKKVSMSDPQTAADFLRWGKKTCPAERYGVIFWDHGGGTALGFGCDEFFPADTLDLSELRSAFRQADLTADFIGFDACLMGTIEAAAALSEAGDYLIASEETEPDCGWSYEPWLTALGQQPELETIQLGRLIAQESFQNSRGEEKTHLSLIDIKKVKILYSKISLWMEEQEEIFSAFAPARSRLWEFGEGEYDQIDLSDFLSMTAAPEELRSLAEEAVIYTSPERPKGEGVGFYFPYRFPQYYSVVSRELSIIDPDFKRMDAAMGRFLSPLADAKKAGDGVSLAAQLTEWQQEEKTIDLTKENWYQSSSNPVQPEKSLAPLSEKEFNFTDKNNPIVHLSPEQLSNLDKAMLEVYAQAGNGYLYFGTLPTEPTEQGLTASFDRLWFSPDGSQLVPFYTIEEVDGVLRGYTTASLNLRENIQLVFNWDGEQGRVEGYRIAPEDEDTPAFPSRGLQELQPGDQLDFYCPYYTNAGSYEPNCYIGQAVTVGRDGLTITRLPMYQEQNIYIGFRLTQLDQRRFWSAPMLR